jgi:hypothetical protein
LTGGPVALPQVSLSDIPALQNVPASTTVTIRYYASGQTTTGGWGFSSATSGTIGLAVGGNLTLSGPTDTTPPAATSITPTDDSATAIPTTDLTITYDETILVNTGTVTLRKSSDNSTVETITVPSAAVTVSGATATINPSVTLNYSTSYYVEVSAGAFKDFAGNPAPATGGQTVWNFATRAASQIVISQYHEGDGSGDRYVELKNLTGSPVSLDGYRLAVWSDTPPSDHEGWKSGAGTTDRITSLDGFTIPANGYFLVAEAGPVAPGYAASNNDLVAQTGGATAFNGDDSVVLYNGAGFSQPEVVDAVSFTANQGENKSFYRLTDQIGFDFSAGTSVLDYAAAWGTKTVAEVNAATIALAWYLRASTIPETLSLEITPSSFLESASTTDAATATVTRSGPTTADLDVTISVSDLSEAAVQETIVTIPAGSVSAQFPVGAVDDSFKDGDKTVSITVSALTFSPASQQVTVLDDLTDPTIPVVINEVDCDTTGTDTAEFVELYNNSSEPVTMDGLVLVFYNGGDDTSYDSIDLTGTIPANGFFVVANPGVPNANMTFAAGDMQNGADAIALYAGSSSEFSSHLVTVANAATLLDAVVYDTSDSDDDGLLAALTPGKPQIDEGATTVLREAHSISRIPNGGAAFDTTAYVTQTPTPGATNILPAGNTYGSWATANANSQASTLDFDNDGVKNGVEYFFGASGSSFTPNPHPVNGVISYPRDETATAADFKIYTSPDLTIWTDVTATPDVDLSDPAFVKYTVPPGPGKNFVRLEVVVAP